MKKLYLWATKQVDSKYALAIFSLLIFIEAFLFMPVNTLLIIFGVARPKRAFFFATLAWLFSLLGAVVAYYLGWIFWKVGLQEILHYILAPERFDEIAKIYSRNEVLAVFGVSLMPIPFKLVTLTAGFFRLPFLPYFLSILVARFIRFYGIALGIYLFGDKIKEIFEKYFYWFLVLLIILTSVTLFFLFR